MKYQWDKHKAASNLQKHGIEFADAVSVFSDDLAITIPDQRFDEDRFEQKEMLLEIVKNQMLEARRVEIAEDAKESIATFYRGELQPQSVESIISELKATLVED